MLVQSGSRSYLRIVLILILTGQDHYDPRQEPTIVVIVFSCLKRRRGLPSTPSRFLMGDAGTKKAMKHQLAAHKRFLSELIATF